MEEDDSDDEDDEESEVEIITSNIIPQQTIVQQPTQFVETVRQASP